MFWYILKTLDYLSLDSSTIAYSVDGRKLMVPFWGSLKQCLLPANQGNGALTGSELILVVILMACETEPHFLPHLSEMVPATTPALVPRGLVTAQGDNLLKNTLVGFPFSSFAFYIHGHDNLAQE